MTTFHLPGGKPESVPTDIGSLDTTANGELAAAAFVMRRRDA